MPPFKVKSVSVPLPLTGVFCGAFVSAEKSLEENSIYMTVSFLIFCVLTAKERTKVTQANTICSPGSAGHFKKGSVMGKAEEMTTHGGSGKWGLLNNQQD